MTTYDLRYYGTSYMWFPWTGTTWVYSQNPSNKSANLTSAINSNNLYTVPFDSYVYYYQVSITVKAAGASSYNGNTQTGVPNTSTNYIAFPNSGVNLGRVYTGYDINNFYSATAYHALDPDFYIRLVKNPVHLSSLGTTIYANAFPFTSVSGGVTRLLNSGDQYDGGAYYGTNSGADQLSANDKLGIVIFRENTACSTTGAVNATALGHWLNHTFDVNVTLKLARR